MSACFFCGQKCRKTSVYVIGESDWAASVKVGYAANPSKRLAQIRKQTGRDVAILHIIHAHCEFKAMDIEDASHRLLAPQWSGYGEWFNCDPDFAFEAVKKAAKRLGLKGKRL